MLESMRNSMRQALSVLVIGFSLLLAVAPDQVHAQSGAAESNEEQLRRSQDLSRTIMSPFCPGRTLDSCPSPYATEWREDIRDMVAEGMSNEEIKAALKKRTHKDLTGAPSTALDSVLPVVVTIAALLLLILLLRALVRPSKVIAAPEKPETEKKPPADRKELDQRLDRELDELDDT